MTDRLTTSPPAVVDKSASEPTPLRARSPVLKHLRAVLIGGLLTAIPLFITVTILMILYEQITKFTARPANWIVENLLAPWSSTWISAETLVWITTPVLALLISLLLVYVLGLLGNFFIGRQIIAQFEHFISNLPLIKGIYGTTKQVMAVFRQGGGGAGFQRVVLVEFPRHGTWTIAFVTNTIHDAARNQKLVCCFIPMTPNPTSGFFQMFPEADVRNTDWSVDTGIKIVLSGGLLAPHELETGSLPPTAAAGSPIRPTARNETPAP